MSDSESNSMEYCESDEADLNDTTVMDAQDEGDDSDGAEDFIGLSASETESDEDDDEEEDADAEPKSKADKLKENILKRYEENKGTKLYIRFPQKLPASDEEFEKQVHALSPLITKAHRPRQKHARFCLVDFANQEDRDAALKKIRKKHGDDGDVKDDADKIYATIPRTEDEQFVRDLAEKKLQSLENKRAKARLKRASKVAQVDKNYTSTVVVLNLPGTTTVTELRQLFPHAIDIQMRKNKYAAQGTGTGVAAITLPTPMDARQAVNQKLSIAGAPLVMRFDKKTLKQNNKKTTIQKNKKKKNNKNRNKKPKQGKTTAAN